MKTSEIEPPPSSAMQSPDSPVQLINGGAASNGHDNVKVPQVNVGQFFRDHGEALGLKLLGANEEGFERRIGEPTINRPGLALSGFYEYFAHRRIQVIGSAELTYLKSLEPQAMASRFRELCARRIPCLVFSRGATVPKPLLEEAARAGIAVFRTPSVTMRFINAATIALEMDFAPSKLEHGSMVDILGIGVLIRGDSGIGKSECVLGLIERGYSLVADDITRVSVLEHRELIGTAPAVTRYHMEVRGLGLINVASIFGIGSIRLEKRLDLVVTLKGWNDSDEVDRTGLEREVFQILHIQVPHVTIPVRPGRDLARLIEVAALDQKLKSLGRNCPQEFNQRLIDLMHRRHRL